MKMESRGSLGTAVAIQEMAIIGKKGKTNQILLHVIETLHRCMIFHNYVRMPKNLANPTTTANYS